MQAPAANQTAVRLRRTEKSTSPKPAIRMAWESGYGTAVIALLPMAACLVHQCLQQAILYRNYENGTAMLIIEIGSALSTSESYASVAGADARCIALGVVDWGARAEDDKEVALRLATQFMLTNYRARWGGRRCTQTQALDWPRVGVCVDGYPVPSNIVPVDVVNACIDLAVRAARGVELLPDLEVGNNQIKRDKTGPLETEYFENATNAAARFVAVDAMLEPYFGSAGGANMVKVVRA